MAAEATISKECFEAGCKRFQGELFGSADGGHSQKVFKAYDPVWVNEMDGPDKLSLVNEKGIIIQVIDNNHYYVELTGKRCSMMFDGSELSLRSDAQKGFGSSIAAELRSSLVEPSHKLSYVRVDSG